jgi:phage-related minor tail protein
VLLAYNGFCQKLRQHTSHAEITLNSLQDELEITFKLRGKEDQGQRELVPWVIEARTKVLFGFTPNITAHQVATRIRDTVREGITERTKKLRWCHTQQVELSNL